MNVPVMMTTDATDPLQQMRQQQMFAQQATHFRPVNVHPASSSDLFGMTTASTQNFNGSLSKMMADEGQFYFSFNFPLLSLCLLFGHMCCNFTVLILCTIVRTTSLAI